MKPFLTKVWGFLQKYVIAPVPAILVIAGAAILVVFGAKNVQIGGILGKLFGHKPVSPETEGTKVEVANSIPDDRVDSDGKVIPLGTPDSKGVTQAVVVPIQPPGMFSNPSTVVINHPESQKPVAVALPDGVKAKDVDKVIVVTPKVVAVTVKSSSKVSDKTVDDLLSKYGGS